MGRPVRNGPAKPTIREFGRGASLTRFSREPDGQELAVRKERRDRLLTPG